MARIRTTGSRIRVRRTRSPTASTVWPKISKPIPTLATVAGAKAVTSVSTSGPCLIQASKMRAKIRGQTQQVGEYATGGDLGAGPWSLHDQRIVAIAARCETYHIV